MKKELTANYQIRKDNNGPIFLRFREDGKEYDSTRESEVYF